MDTSSTVFKALDVLTIVTAREGGVTLPDLALALNQPRSNVVRIVHTLQHYGFIVCKRRQWIATATFRAWGAPADRHVGFRRRYRTVLDALSAGTGELVMLGLHEGNGIIHLDALASPDGLCRAPAPDIRYSLRLNALGKLALSRRTDLAAKFEEPEFHQELEEVRRTGVAWSQSHGGSDRGSTTMAIPGFSNLPTEPMLAVVWPKARFTEKAAERARQIAAEAMETALRENAGADRIAWTSGHLPAEFRAMSVA